MPLKMLTYFTGGGVFELDFGDGGVHVAARVEVFRVEAADCPCDTAGGIVHVALRFHRLPAVGAEPVVFSLVVLSVRI